MAKYGELNKQLYDAVARNDLDRATTILAKGADVNTRGGMLHGTVLMAGCCNGNDAMVHMLLSKEAAVNETDRFGDTALIEAGARGYERVVNLLIQNHAQLQQQGEGGRAAIHWAVINNHPSIINCLVSNGANVDIEDDEGKAPLWHAAAEGLVNCVELLLGAGANPHHTSKDEGSPLDVSKERRAFEIEQMLNGAVTSVAAVLRPETRLLAAGAEAGQVVDLKRQVVQQEVKHTSNEQEAAAGAMGDEELIRQLVERFTDKNRRLENKQNELDAALRHKTAVENDMGQQLANLQREGKALHHENQTLRHGRDDERKEKENLQHALSKVRKEKGRLRRTLDEERRLNEALEHARVKDGEEKEALRHTLRENQREIEALQYDRDENRREIETIQRARDDDQREKEAIRHSRDEARREIEALRFERDEERREKTTIAEEKALLQHQLVEQQRENATLEQDIERQRENVLELNELLAGSREATEEIRQMLQDSDEIMNIPSRDIRMTRQKLGKGSYGEVCIAHWKGCPVAVKMLYEVLARSLRNIQLLLQEISIAWKVHHPNIASVCGVVLELQQDRKTAWIVMELLQGSMADVIDAPHKGALQLTLREKVDMALDSICGLNYLHSLARLVLHGDIRPTNILITSVMRAKLGDLGAARFADASLSTGPVSPEYAAPERMTRRSAPKSKETDIYSTGVTLCELFTGVPPNPPARMDQIQLIRQRNACILCNRMVSRDPGRRPSAEAALTAIARIRETGEYTRCPPRRMVKGKMDGEDDVTLTYHMW